MSAQDARVVVVGSINADLAVTVDRHPRPGETLTGQGGTYTPGGKGANQALAAQLAGASTAFVGAVGQDANAAGATALLQKWGVRLHALSSVPGPTGLAVITVDAAGENSIIVIPGANGAVTAGLIAGHEPVIAGAEVVICQCEIPTEAIVEAARLTRGRFILNLAPVTPVPLEVLRRCEPLVVNEHEARGLLAHLDGDESADDDAAGDDEQVAERIRRHGISALVITLGAAGALVADDDGLTRVPSAPVRAVDTTARVMHSWAPSGRTWPPGPTCAKPLRSPARPERWPPLHQGRRAPTSSH